MLFQEVKKLETSKKKLKEHTEKLQETIKRLGRKNYYLGREGKVLRGLVGNYQSQIKILKGFALMGCILEQLVVGLYLLGLFDGNNACVIIF